MIGTHQISNNVVAPGFGVLCNPCCKVEEVASNTGGRRRFRDNPFIAFTPNVTADQVPTPQLEIPVPNESIALQRISQRVMLGKEISERRSLRTSVRPGQHPLGMRTATNVELTSAFQKFLLWEEDEFIALILAADDDDCYDCFN